MPEASPAQASKAEKPAKETSMEDDWQKLKIQNQLLNSENAKIEAAAALQGQDLPLAYNEDGSLNFFWIDAHEEGNGQEIYLFGKVWQPQVNAYVSCTLLITGMERTMYALPKVKGGKARGTLTKEEEDKLLMNVYTELEEMRKRRF